MNEPLIQMIKTQSQDIPVESWTTSVDGIVVTMPPITEELDGYRVTHKHSGLAIVKQTFPTIPIARLFVERISSFANWNSNDVDNLSDDREALKRQVNKAFIELDEQLQEDASKVIQLALTLSNSIDNPT